MQSALIRWSNPAVLSRPGSGYGYGVPLHIPAAEAVCKGNGILAKSEVQRMQEKVGDPAPELGLGAHGLALCSCLLAGEKKLSKVIVPDKWKEGASNTKEAGGRKINENKLLSSKKR
eukprot:SM000051S17591  [mRNA]  locus=s51:538190:538540:- [translate_table: standard]